MAIPAFTAELITRLEAIPWVAKLPFRQVEELAAYLELREYEEGTVLFREGAQDHFLGFIVSGRVRITKDDGHGQERELATLGRGTEMGEMSLVDGHPRSASGQAVEDCVVLVLRASSFQKVKDENPALALVLLTRMATLISQKLRATSGHLVEILH
jgi:CRP-like cAMP-binding protein